jgi:hypothetical protein
MNTKLLVAALNIILSVNVKRMLTDFVKNNFLIISIQLKFKLQRTKHRQDYDHRCLKIGVRAFYNHFLYSRNVAKTSKPVYHNDNQRLWQKPGVLLPVSAPVK